jgi:hypothetical protein
MHRRSLLAALALIAACTSSGTHEEDPGEGGAKADSQLVPEAELSALLSDAVGFSALVLTDAEGEDSIVCNQNKACMFPARVAEDLRRVEQRALEIGGEDLLQKLNQQTVNVLYETLRDPIIASRLAAALDDNVVDIFDEFQPEP